MVDGVWFGFNAPFYGGLEKVMSRQVDERLIKNDLLQLIMTVPGERFGRPDFGTNLRITTFEQMDQETLDELSDDIANQIRKYEPRVTITSVLIQKDEDRNLINVKIYGYVNIKNNYTEINSLLLELNMPLNRRS